MPLPEDTLFASALALPPAERAAYLARACAGDATLCARVEELLRAHETARDFLSSPPTRLPQGEQPGEQIGRYKLLQKIGEGGCGLVYMAEQEEPLRRRVAIKVIKLGMDTREVVARFEAERQALALMDHPNIAKVFDAGATASGRPFFVMELVRGVPITKYCDEQNLPTAARLGLFMQVCHAVQHAHQKGIIHRDLKPSNILVTMHDGVPVPKVIDFGIAKATQGKLTDQTLFTAFEQFIGTPAYMSPEQAELSGLDVDTRADIYSLGVLLYELLVGWPPFDPKSLLSAGLDEIRRIIREVDPPRPSARLSTLTAADRATVARLRGAAPAQLSTTLRGDLDWIVMRCLEKNRTRRYETAGNLARDIQRHLQDEPVDARPPSTAYLLQKILRRHRLAAATAAAVFAALAAGLTASLYSLARERQAHALAAAAENRATSEGRKSTQVARFLEDMLRGIGPSVSLGRDTTLLREIADRTAERISRELQGQPEVEADLRMTLGSLYEQLGEPEKAEKMFRDALRLRQTLFGADNPKTWASTLSLAGIRAERGDITEAENLLNQALASQDPTAAGSGSAGTPALFAATQQLQWRLLAARQKAGADPRDTVRTLNNIGGIALMSGNLDEAEKALNQALALCQQSPGPAHEDIVLTWMNLGALAHMRSQYPEAENRWNEALALQRQLAGPDHPSIADLLMNLGALAWARHDFAAAEARFLESLAMQRRLLPAAHENIAKLLDNLGALHLALGQPAAAEASYREALAMRRKLFGDQSTFVAASLAGLGEVLLTRQQWTEAEKLQREALAIREQHDPDDWNVHYLRHKLGANLSRQQRFREAEPLLVEGYVGMKQRADRIRPDFRAQMLPGLLQDLASFYAETGRSARAAEWREKLEACKRSLLADPAGTRFP